MAFILTFLVEERYVKSIFVRRCRWEVLSTHCAIDKPQCALFICSLENELFNSRFKELVGNLFCSLQLGL